ncbi:MAG: ribosome biogenesis GTPase A, partial [Parasphingorhabdus sp.]
MSIHWYPGHMHKASNEMIETLPLVNVVVEVLDARIPYSSSNPFIGNLCTEKPSIKLLNKTDLAEP